MFASKGWATDRVPRSILAAPSLGRRAVESASMRRAGSGLIENRALVTSEALWDFAKVPILPPDRATPFGRIDPASISLEPIRGSAAGSAARQADGSLEDSPDDQDSLTPSVFERKPSGRGVHIRVSGGVPNGTTAFPDGVRWIQTIDTNAPLFPNQSPPYVDFVPPPDNKPFYFSDAMEVAQGGTFSDSPTRRANGVRWDATLSLVGVAGHNVTRLDSVNYGFDIDASGTLSLHGPSKTGVASVVVHGDTLRSEYPDWSFSGGFAAPQVPDAGGGAGPGGGAGAATTTA